MRYRTQALALALAAALPLAACDEDGGAQNGRMTLLLTDAEGDVEAAVVTISEVYLQPGDDENDAGRVVLLDVPFTTNLVTLSNDIDDIVEDVVVPAGSYQQLRLVVDGAYIEVDNGDGTTRIYATPGYDEVPDGETVDGTLLCPSCAQSGLKLVLPGGGIDIDGDTHVLLLDFDVAESFGHQAGNSGMWVMHPVIHVTEFQSSATITADIRLAEDVTLPEIDGTQLTLGSFVATLMDEEGNDEGDAEFSDSDGDGVYTATFNYVVPGTYTVGVEAPEGVTVTLDPTSDEVTVGSSGSATASFVVTAVE